MRDFYKPVSKYYDTLSAVYSLGRISRCRSAFVRDISEAVSKVGAGMDDVTVCLAGVGHGGEAIALAEEGVMVTVVDISASMLEEFMKKLDRVSDEVRGRVRVVHDDIRNVELRFDWVVANFFLNVFGEVEMEDMLGVLLDRCESGGSLVIGDFCYDVDGNVLVRTLQKLNWNLALFVFRIFVKNARHRIYDYGVRLRGFGWELVEARKFGIFGVSFYQAVRFCEMSDESSVVTISD